MSAEDSIDIDTPSDLKLVEFLLGGVRFSRTSERRGGLQVR